VHDVNDDAIIGKRTNFLRGQFRERIMREFFTGKKRQHTIIYYLLNTTRKCIIYSLYIIKLHGSHCFSSSSSSLSKRRENSSSALECCLFARVFALTILMSLSARTAAFFFLGGAPKTCVLNPKP
jgi:hypothetical protein